MKTLKNVVVSPRLATSGSASIPFENMADLYRKVSGDYPKFFKMDKLCQLGFLAAEILLKELNQEEKENISVILFNRNGSLITDRNYQGTIGENDYFPSPALFVYTLANIVSGEIAIRHKIYGETSFFVLSAPDRKVMDEIVSSSLLTSSPDYILTGWVDYENENEYLADFSLIKP